MKFVECNDVYVNQTVKPYSKVKNKNGVRGFMHRPYASALCIGLLHWPFALDFCIGLLHWTFALAPALALCIGLLHWTFALALCN